MPDSGQQQELFGSRLERVTRLGGTRPVPVTNSSEALWVQDASGRQWVIKWEENTGVEPLLAEAVSWLVGEHLGAPQPHCAVFVDGDTRAWMSERVPNVVHWDPSQAHFLTNPEELGAMLTLDAITHNEDRHAGNILLQPDPDEVHLRGYAIDSGNALVGWTDFHECELNVPQRKNLAAGLPVDLLETGALLAASRAEKLHSAQILALVTEACEIARDPSAARLHAALSSRLEHASVIVKQYLQHLRTQQP